MNYLRKGGGTRRLMGAVRGRQLVGEGKMFELQQLRLLLEEEPFN